MWTVSLWCLQCDHGTARLVGQPNRVSTAGRAQHATAQSLDDLWAIMRRHELEAHEGQS